MCTCWGFTVNEKLVATIVALSSSCGALFFVPDLELCSCVSSRGIPKPTTPDFYICCQHGGGGWLGGEAPACPDGFFYQTNRQRAPYRNGFREGGPLGPYSPHRSPEMQALAQKKYGLGRRFCHEED